MKGITYIKESVVDNQETYFLIFVLFGYILCYFDPFSSDLLSHIINILVRGTVFLLSIYYLVKNFKLIKKRKFVIVTFLLLYLLYFIKAEYTFNNFYFQDSFQELRKVFYYYSLIIIPVPVIALISLNYLNIDFKLFYKGVFWFLTIVLGFNLLYFLFIIGRLDKGGSGIFRSYYILVGHYGLSLVLLCIYSFLFLKKWNFIYMLAFFLGLFAIYISAARSPLLAFFVITFILLAVKNNMKYWIYFCVLIIGFIIILFMIYKSDINQDILFFKRVNAAIFEGNASGRSIFFSKGLNEFFAHPVLGGRTLLEGGAYSHNIFIDSLMSIGLIGTLLFIIYGKFVVISLIKLLKNIYQYKEAGILAFFFLQYLILVQTSGSIYLSFEFWYFSGVLIGLGYINYNNEKIKSNDSRGNTAGNH